MSLLWRWLIVVGFTVLLIRWLGLLGTALFILLVVYGSVWLAREVADNEW